MTALEGFDAVWLVDFEFHQPNGERPMPLCMAAREYFTGQTIRLWRSALLRHPVAPFGTGESSLFVAYYASAELGCFLELGWPMPTRILDLFVEFRNRLNGKTPTAGYSLLGAMVHFGLDAMSAAEKADKRDLAIRGGPYTYEEADDLLDYCESDVDNLARLLPKMLSGIDLPRALYRGRYMAAVARMERTGTPVDAYFLARLKERWTAIQGCLIDRIDADYGVYVPTGLAALHPSIRAEAEEAAIDPFDLRDAVEEVHNREREMVRERADAVRNARRETGLTPRAISRIENSGKDSSNVPHLDTKARELAGKYPALGIGHGYDSAEGYDDTDYTGGLFDVLREPTPRARARLDRSVIEEAASFVVASQVPGQKRNRPRSFSTDRFGKWLARSGIPWPRLPTGALDLSQDTFREMARAHPAVAPLRELRHTLGEMRLFELWVGKDGRNRCLLSPFSSKTGRNQPSNTKFVFGPSCWLRSLIRPEPGRSLAYLDYSQQEFAIAAALSGDGNMQDAYVSGDPYLAFAKQAGAVPEDATKQTHGQVRDQFKACVLAVQYGMGEESLSHRIGKPPAYAKELLRLHRETYPKFWRWSESTVDFALLNCWLRTAFGWRLHVEKLANPRSLANFPCQANGAEMLRLACCMVTEAGIAVCAPVHDAILIEAATDAIGETVARAQALMEGASQVVLGGFTVRTDAKVVDHPDRYSDARGGRMWQTVEGILEELEAEDGPPGTCP